MASKRLQAERGGFKRYKEDVSDEGKPFFPYAMLHDTVMSLVVVVVIVGLACVWYFTRAIPRRAKDSILDSSARSSTTRPTRARRTSSRGRTGSSTSSSTCYASSNGRRRSCSARSVSRRSLLILLIGLPFYDRRPGAAPAAPARSR